MNLFKCFQEALYLMFNCNFLLKHENVSLLNEINYKHFEDDQSYRAIYIFRA